MGIFAKIRLQVGNGMGNVAYTALLFKDSTTVILSVYILINSLFLLLRFLGKLMLRRGRLEVNLMLG